MVAEKIKKLGDVIKMTSKEIARRKRNLDRFKWKKKKKSSTISRYKIDEKKGGHDTWLKEHDDFLKDQIKRKKEKEGWDQLLAKGGSVTNQRRLAKRGWGATKRK